MEFPRAWVLRSKQVRSRSWRANGAEEGGYLEDPVSQMLRWNGGVVGKREGKVLRMNAQSKFPSSLFVRYAPGIRTPPLAAFGRRLSFGASKDVTRNMTKGELSGLYWIFGCRPTKE